MTYRVRFYFLRNNGHDLLYKIDSSYSTRFKMNWTALVLFLETWVFIYALYVDEKCYHTNPCHRHTLKCYENLQNKESRIIAITEAKFGFKTATCTIEGCSKECCKEETGDCFEPFSKNSTIQTLLYDQCEFREECSLDESYRVRGCKGGRSSYSRIEYECLEESSILRTTGTLPQKKMSLFFNGSDPNFPDTGISCSIRTHGLLRVTHYYTRLTRDGSKDQVTSKSDYFDRTDCKTRHKMFLQVDDGSLVLCHDEGEFLYSSPVDFKDSSLNLVINQLDDTDVIWIGFYAPQAGGTVEVQCNNLHTSAPSVGFIATTTTTTTNMKLATDDKVYVGVGVSILVICIVLLAVLVFLFKRRTKSKKDPVRKYSEIADNDHDEGSHYTSADENHAGNGRIKVNPQNNRNGEHTGSKSTHSDQGYTYVDQEYLIKPNSVTTSADVQFQPICHEDFDAYTYVDQDHLQKRIPVEGNVSVVELQSPDSPKYNRIGDQKLGKSTVNTMSGPFYSEVVKQKKLSKDNTDGTTDSDTKSKGDKSNEETNTSSLEEVYNHLSAFTSKSRNLKSDKFESDYDHMDSPGKGNSSLKSGNIDNTYSHIN